MRIAPAERVPAAAVAVEVMFEATSLVLGRAGRLPRALADDAAATSETAGLAEEDAAPRDVEAPVVMRGRRTRRPSSRSGESSESHSSRRRRRPD